MLNPLKSFSTNRKEIIVCSCKLTSEIFWDCRYFFSPSEDYMINFFLRVVATMCLFINFKIFLIVYSNEWNMCKNLFNLGFEHLTFTHLVNFCYTNRSPYPKYNILLELRTSCTRMKGVRKVFLQSYFNELTLRDNVP